MSQKSGGVVYVALETFSAEIDGSPQMVYKGQTRVREGHPLLKGREALFAPVELSVDYDVEQATAEPGEKRQTSLSEKASERSEKR